MGMRHPIAEVRGLGSAKEGTGHWIVQRVNSIALLPLTIWFLYSALTVLGQGYADARAFVAQPLNATLLAAFALTTFHHAQLGLQVVIEDYVHLRWLELASQLLVKYVGWFAMLLCLLAIIRITLGG